MLGNGTAEGWEVDSEAVEADCTQGALVLFRCPEIRCSKKSV